MEIAIVGSGAREYSIGLALQGDCRIDGIYFYPGNGATSQLGKNIDFQNQENFIAFVLSQRIGFVIIGPEEPLVNGLADRLRERGIAVFGPSKRAARLEGSKAFMKDFLKRHGIPTARFLQTQDYKEACAFAQTLPLPVVIKADGLCAGKGVILAQSYDEAQEVIASMLSGERFGKAGETIIIEEFLDGYELSVFALCDGKDYIVLPATQDHKRLCDGDEGPNTGGMGAYVPAAPKEVVDCITKQIIAPTLDGMAREGNAFFGVLFCGVMMVGAQPYVLEFNVRFGDPECEVLMPLFKHGLLDCLMACAKGGLREVQYELEDKACVGVVVATQEYPYASPKKRPISIAKFDPKQGVGHIAYGGVIKQDNTLYTHGGRVGVCVGEGKDAKQAARVAYELVKSITFDGMQYRSDIAHQVLNPKTKG